MQTNRIRFWLVIAIICSPTVQTWADEALEVATAVDEGPVDFEKEILPILRRNCLACHSSTNSQSDLILETPQTILKGGSEGPAVVAGKSADSLIFQTAAHIEESFMPPDDNEVGARNLTPQELGLLKLWIDQGAKGEVLGIAAAPDWQPLPARVNPIYAVAITANGDYLAASRANQIFMYHVPGKMLIGRLTDPNMVKSGTYDKPGVAHFDLVQSLAFSPDGGWLASGGYRTVKLWKRTDGIRQAELPKADGAVLAMACSNDGGLLAVAEDNGNIKLVDLASGTVTHSLAGHEGAVNGLSFSSDASQLVSGGADKTYRIWNTADGQEIAKAATPSSVTAITFAAADKQIVTAEEDNVIRTWSVDFQAGDTPEGEAPKPVKELKGHTARITGLAVMPGTATHVVSASQDASVRRWDAGSGNVIRQFSHGGPVAAIAVRPDGKRIATVSDNGTAKLWDADSGQPIVELDYTTSLKHKVNQANLAVAVGKRRVDNAKKDLDEANKRKKSEEDNSKKAEESVTKSEEDLKKKIEAAKKPEEEMLAAEKALKEAEPKVPAAEAAQKKADEDLKAAEEALKKAQADAATTLGDGAADEDAKAKATKAVEEADTKHKAAQEAKKNADAALKSAQEALKKAQENLKNKTNAAQKLIDGRNAAERALEAAKRSVIRSKELVKIAADAIPVSEADHKREEEAHQQLQTAQQAVQQELTAAAAQQRKPMRAVAFSPDGLQLAIAGEDPLIRTFSGETGQSIATITSQSPIVGLAFAAGEGSLIAAGSDKSLVVWSATPVWQLARTIGAHDKPDQLVDRVTSLHFSPDSKILATGGGEPSRSGELKIWNVETGSLIRHFADSHSDVVLGVEFSPDAKHIASCASDRYMKVFDVSTGEHVRSFEGHTHHVLGVSWRADGRVLATCGADKAVKVWDFRTGELTKTIQGFNKEVTSIEFMGSSDNMMCSSGDKKISAKNTGGGNVRDYGGPADFMYSVRSSADGKVIAAGGQDSIVRVWNENGQTIINFEPPIPTSEPNQQASK